MVFMCFAVVSIEVFNGFHGYHTFLCIMHSQAMLITMEHTKAWHVNLCINHVRTVHHFGSEKMTTLTFGGWGGHGGCVFICNVLSCLTPLALPSWWNGRGLLFWFYRYPVLGVTWLRNTWRTTDIPTQDKGKRAHTHMCALGHLCVPSGTSVSTPTSEYYKTNENHENRWKPEWKPLQNKRKPENSWFFKY